MKLASLKNGQRDGVLVVVDRKLATCAKVPQIAQTLQQAIESWATAAPKLKAVYDQLNAGKAAGAEMPPNFETEPLMYQAVSDGFIGPLDDMPFPTDELGVDMEAEVAV